MNKCRYNTRIMSAAVGYTGPLVQPFLNSLRRTGYTGDVLRLLSRGLARRAASLPLFEGVKLLSAPQWSPLKRCRW